MCLTICPFATKEFFKEKIIVYKILRKMNGKLCAPFRSVHSYKPGWKKSDSTRTTYQKSGTLNKGIHTFRTKQAAQDYKKSRFWGEGHQYVIVKMTGSKKDVIGVNDTQLVFTKIHLDKSEYNRVIGKFHTIN